MHLIALWAELHRSHTVDQQADRCCGKNEFEGTAMLLEEEPVKKDQWMEGIKDLVALF